MCTSTRSRLTWIGPSTPRAAFAPEKQKNAVKCCNALVPPPPPPPLLQERRSFRPFAWTHCTYRNPTYPRFARSPYGAAVFPADCCGSRARQPFETRSLPSSACSCDTQRTSLRLPAGHRGNLAASEAAAVVADVWLSTEKRGGAGPAARQEEEMTTAATLPEQGGV